MGERWVSIKPWGQTQVHSGSSFGHKQEKCWFLGMEFKDTQVVKWCEIPPWE